MNALHSLLLLTVMAASLAWGGYALAGETGFAIAVAASTLLSLGAYWFSDQLVLRMYEARPLSALEAAGFRELVQRLSLRAGLPMPRLYVIPEAAPNAFATGRNPAHASIIVTEGLLELLDEAELEGVVAHELAHVRRRDTLLMSLVATIAGAIGSVIHFALWGTALDHPQSKESPGAVGSFLGLLFALLAALPLQMTISSAREFTADAEACHLTGNPGGLASALERLEKHRPLAPMYAGSPVTSHLFIVNPFSEDGILRLFQTHPPVPERIRRLKSLEGGLKMAA